MKTYNGIYLVGNYPEPEIFVEAAVEGMRFFDFLEVGIPFSDPVADGPVIAAAANEMVESGVTFTEILNSISIIRKRIPPKKNIYLMTYANHVFHKGIEKYADACREMNISGIIIPDVPYVESGRFKDIFNRYERDYIHFITPENTLEQIETISKSAQGFLYAVSMRGITGIDLNLDTETKKKISHAGKISSVPVVLGFGIKSTGSAKEALACADGFIMGTKMVELISSGDLKRFTSFVNQLGDELSMDVEKL